MPAKQIPWSEQANQAILTFQNGISCLITQNGSSTIEVQLVLLPV